MIIEIEGATLSSLVLNCICGYKSGEMRLFLMLQKQQNQYYRFITLIIQVSDFFALVNSP